MAGKKVKKAPAKKAACSCCESGFGNLEEWLLIFLGALGLAQVLSVIAMPAYFAYVWSVLVLVIGIMKLMNKANCTC